MSLSAFKVDHSVKWTFTRTNAPFKDVKAGPESFDFAFSPTLANAYVATLTLAAAGTHTIDLTSFTNLVFESTPLTSVRGLFVNVTGTGYLTVAPGASNGLVWFWGAGTLTLKPGGFSYFTDTPTTVDGTHKTLDLANPGGGSITVEIVIPGAA